MAVWSVARPLRLRSREGAEAGRKVTWLELFFDLVFVAAVSQVGEPLVHDYSPAGLGRFAFLFLLIWWAWHGHTNYSTRFDTDDGLHRGITLLQMFAAAAMAVNAKGALDSTDSAGFAAAYGVMRALLVVQYLRARQIEASRALTNIHCAGFTVAAALWLASALVPTPVRFGLWAIAFVVDVLTPLLTSRHLVDAPPDAAHLPERFGLFTIILIGEAMVGVMHGMESQATWTPDAALSAFFGMATVFAIWWWYFDAARAAEERVIRTPRDARRFQWWTQAHLPAYLGIAVTAVGVHHLIGVAGRDAHLHAAEAWILCGGAALVMSGLTVISRSTAPAPRGRARGRIALAAAAAALGAVGPLAPASVLLAALLALFVAQAAMR
jgi:low temperature requirement protein LtrA